MSLLTVSNIVAGYGETEILHGVSIAIEEGHIVTIIGPNGSGKSTLLKAIFGLVKPREGQVLFQGKDITEQPYEKTARIPVRKPKSTLTRKVVMLPKRKRIRISSRPPRITPPMPSISQVRHR